MKQVLNIAVFGLSLNTLDQIKTQILLAKPMSINIQWVNIAEQHIDILLVNDMFFHSSNIQKILTHNVDKYLRLVKNEESAGKIIGDQLSYPLSHIDELQNWLKESLLQTTSQIKKIDSPTIAEVKTVNSDSNAVFREIFTPRNGFIQLFDNHGYIALIDTRTERVWNNPEHIESGFNQTLNQTYATNQFVQDTIKNKRAQDLRIWLWKMVKHSTDLSLPLVNENQYFKLNIWPQLENSSNRRDLLKISACFAKGAQIKDVAKHLNLPVERIIRFVAMNHLLQMGKFIEQPEAKFIVLNKNSEENQVGKVRSFLGKLRKKLGL